MQSIPINTLDSPNAVLELIYRIKVKDVMTREVKTAAPEQLMSHVRDMLKRKSITGIPIIHKKKIVGIVSMEDVLHSMEAGTFDQPASRYMSRKIIVLEEDMPIFFAISYFERYSFRRFPVVNRQNELVGIITSRDITTKLLMEAHRVIEKLENENSDSDRSITGHIERWFAVKRYDFENAGYASTEIRKILKSKQIDRATARRISIAAYELEMNLVVHSNDGSIHFLMDDHRVVIQSEDTGPGIPNVETAMEEGYSTATEWILSLGFGAGLGLPNAKRVSDEFNITSEPSRGTHVKSVILFEKGAQYESP